METKEPRLSRSEKTKRVLSVGLAAVAAISLNEATANSERTKDCQPIAVGFSDKFTDLQDENFGIKAGAEITRFPISSRLDDASDAAYEATQQAGIKPIILIAGWSKWPKTTAAFARKMKKVAKSYPNAIYQLGNEPNLGGTEERELDPDKGMKARRAAAYSIKAARAILSVSEDAEIIGPSVSPVGEWESYLENLYARIPEGMVGVGLNVYPTGPQRIKGVERAYNLAAQFGDVHVTELDVWKGRPSPNATKRAIETLSSAGAETVLLSSLDDHKQEFSAIRSVSEILPSDCVFQSVDKH